MKWLNKLRTRYYNCMLMIKYVLKYDKLIMPLKTVAILFSAIETYIGSVYIKWIIDFISESLTKHDDFDFLKYVYLIFAVQILAVIVYSVTIVISKVIIPRREYVLKNKLQNLFIIKAMEHDLSEYENFEFYDTYTKTVRYADKKALDIVDIFFSAAGNTLKIIAVLTIIMQLDSGVLIIVLIMVVLSAIDQNLSNKYSYEQYEAEATVDRKSEYIKRVAHQKQYAKEVRTFRLSGFLIEKLNNVFAEKSSIFKKSNGTYWRTKYAFHIVNSLVVTPALLIYIGIQMTCGMVSIGGFTVLFTSAFSVSSYLAGIIIDIDKLCFESDFYISKLRKILEMRGKIESGNNGISLDSIETISFKNVYFKYPKHEEWILKNVSFDIYANEHIALVGRNGGGKSTIVKLMIRLYDATKGEISINGIDIKKYNVDSLRSAFSVVLQDYQLFDFSIEDNLSMGKRYTEAEMSSALEFAGIKNRIDTCKAGIKTFIGREFTPDGENFSGGELQKIAIARGEVKKCFFRIYDEANSSLDPFSEYELNKKFRASNANYITLAVTHRLTAAVSADKIIHLENGKIVAIGSHSLLMSGDDKYREMFECQLKAYEANKENSRYE